MEQPLKHKSDVQTAGRVLQKKTTTTTRASSFVFRVKYMSAHETLEHGKDAVLACFECALTFSIEVMRRITISFQDD